MITLLNGTEQNFVVAIAFPLKLCFLTKQISSEKVLENK